MSNNFNRRDFLKTIGLSSAALALPKWSFGDPFSERPEPVFARGQTRVYHGEHLTAISLPVGGIGAGCIQINGRAERKIWQIFNNHSQAFVPDSFFAIRARTKGGEPIIRVLQTSQVGPFEAMKSLSFRGEYPFGWYEFEDDEVFTKAYQVDEKICVEGKCKKERLKFEIKIDKIRGEVFVKNM